MFVSFLYNSYISSSFQKNIDLRKHLQFRRRSYRFGSLNTDSVLQDSTLTETKMVKTRHLPNEAATRNASHGIVAKQKYVRCRRNRVEKNVE